MLIRHPQNPILTRKAIPSIPPHLIDVTSVFNPGAVKVGKKYLLMLRVQNRARETFFVMAEGTDGMNFKVRKEIVTLEGIEKIRGTIFHVYDPRITRLGDDFYIVVAMDMENSCKLGLVRTSDFRQFTFMGIISGEDSRNGVLFPEKINGKYLMLERPNRQTAGGVASGNEIWLSASNDLLAWKPVCPVLQGRWHYWDELIGSGPPPVKTRDGWLHLYHGVATHFSSVNIYQAGVVLLDLEDPSKVVARSRANILEPREMYEMVGQVPNVVFPGGMIVEKFDKDGFALPESPVKIYYGAADTVVGLATTTIAELLKACRME